MLCSPNEDDPIPLPDVGQFFPHAKLKLATLRAERDRGKLDTFFLGRREYTTIRSVREWIERCQDSRQRRTPTAPRADNHASALAALKALTSKPTGRQRPSDSRDGDGHMSAAK